jgi:hypothetical protein
MRQPRRQLARAILAVSLGLVCLLGLAACGRNRGIERRADRFLAYLVAEDYSAASGLCDDRVARTMTPERLKQSWALLRRVVGEFRRETGIHTEMEGGDRVVVVTCEFERRKLDLRATFSDQGKIAHLAFVSAGKKPSAKAAKPTPAPSQPEKRGAGKVVADQRAVVKSRVGAATETPD